MAAIKWLLSLSLSSSLLLAGLANAQPVNKVERVERDKILRKGVQPGGGNTLSWTCPSSRANAEPFDCDTELGKYVLEIQYQKSTVTLDLNAGEVTRAITGDPKGTRYRLRVCDIDSLCSAWSAPAYQF
jgi:hypothetical protein